MTTVGEAGTLSRFSVRVREDSASDHSEAEQMPFVRDLLRGKVDRQTYVELVGQQYFVYQALEAAAEVMKTMPIARAFVREELFRLPALEADLAFLMGADWRNRITTSPATQKYCDRLNEVAFRWEGGFVAHQYVRYLGDLSGGQVLRRIVERNYNLTAEAGASFYNFAAIPDPDAFKSEYRALMDAAPWDSTEQKQIIEEVRLAFRLNIAVFDEMAGRHGPAAD